MASQGNPIIEINMKRSLLIVLLFSSLSVMSMQASNVPSLLRHVVLFSWNPGTEDSKVRELEAAFAALPEKIDAIHSFEWGTDVSVENLSRRYTHCFLVTFENEAARDQYLPHPAHQAFVETIKPHLDQVLVFDYWSR